LNGEPLFALKRWPATHTPERMRLVHERMQSVPYEFVPRLMPSHAGLHVIVHAAHCWDVTAWVDGTPDLLDAPSTARLRSAAQAISMLHDHWPGDRSTLRPCSTVARRLTLLGEWDRTRFRFDGSADEVREVESTLAVVHRLFARTVAELRRAEPLRGRMVPIHGDFWPENVLFNGDNVSGVLDYGNVGFDHPEVDLGRLFADVPGWDRTFIATAVEAYNSNAPYDLSVPLVELLATSGRACSLANWHLRLNAGSPDAHLLPTALPRVRRLAALISDAGRLG
jgi:aminoglycoside phosphotransferase (APT) family kinase protein